jgi:hypothetical protein
MDADRRFIDELLRAAPDFERVYEEHLMEYDEVLPHVLMGEFTRWFISTVRSVAPPAARTVPSSPALAPVLELLEREWEEGVGSVRELVSASFLENLHQAGPDYQRVKSTLGPRLRDQLARVE